MIDSEMPSETAETSAAPRAGADTVSARLQAARPERNRTASRLDRALAEQALFGRAFEPIRVGRYILLEHIGKGGMGEVFAAYDDQLDRKVAIKLVRAGAGAIVRANERLLREAQTQAQLSHPNVVHVYESGAFHGRVYIAMEYVRGVTLRQWLQDHARDGKRVREGEVLRQFLGVGRGLEAAHRANLVHRDFKPENVLVDRDGRPRVLDFGLARLLSESSDSIDTHDLDERESASAVGPLESGMTGEPRARAGREAASGSGTVPPLRKAAAVLTTNGRIMGTIPYMAPEQLRGEPADARSDQFAFCVALYEALYGRGPFEGSSVHARLESIERGAIAPAVSESGARVSAPVRRALLRGLQHDPAARFPDMTGLLTALSEWPRRRRQRWSIAVAAAAAALVTAGGVGYVRMGAAPDPCAEAIGAIDEVWNPVRRQALEAAFMASGDPLAGTAWRRASEAIDRYADEWKRTGEATCRRARAADSPDLADRRRACLDGALHWLEGALHAFSKADTGAMSSIHAALGRLPELTLCGDTATMLYGVLPPSLQVAQRVSELRVRLAEAEIGAVSGRDDVLAVTADLVERAEESGYRPVLAEAMAVRGLALTQSSAKGATGQGEALLEEASDLAESLRHDALLATIRADLVRGAYRNHSSTERGHALSRRALAAIARIGRPPRLAATVHLLRGLLLFRDGQQQAAEVEQRRALQLLGDEGECARGEALRDLGSTARLGGRYPQARELYEAARRLLLVCENRLEGSIADPSTGGSLAARAEASLRLAELDYHLGKLSLQEGKLSEGRQFLQRAINTWREKLGPDHRSVGWAEMDLAEVLRQQGDLAAAQMHADNASRILERLYGADGAQVALVRALAGAIAYRRGDYRTALREYEAALELEQKHKPKMHIDIGVAHFNLAEAYLALDRLGEAREAGTLAEQVLSDYEDTWGGAVEGAVASVRGRVALADQDLDSAVKLLDTAARRLPRDGFMAMDRADAVWALSRALRQIDQGSTARARDLAREACAIYARQTEQVHIPADAARECSRAAGTMRGEDRSHTTGEGE